MNIPFHISISFFLTLTWGVGLVGGMLFFALAFHLGLLHDCEQKMHKLKFWAVDLKKKEKRSCKHMHATYWVGWKVLRVDAHG